MNAEQRRRANRLRVAAGLSADYVPPGLNGAEVVALAKLNPLPKAHEGNTEFEGGWQGLNDYLVMGRGEAA